MNKKFYIGICTLFLLLLTASITNYAFPGDLDFTFDGDGKVITQSGIHSEGVAAIALQSDGKIVAVGRTNFQQTTHFCVARYNSDGSLDTSFDDDGIVLITSFGVGSYATSVAIQPTDGKIVVVGSFVGGGAVVARYNTNGSLDTFFDGDGKVGVNIDQANSVVIARRRHIYVVGSNPIPGGSGNREIAIAALKQFDGSLDPFFGGTGIVTSRIGTSANAFAAVLINRRHLLVVGTAFDGTSKIALAGYYENGLPDISLGQNGVVTTAISGSSNNAATSVAIDPGPSDYRIVVAGYASTSGAVLRYDSYGTIDTSFDGDGIVVTPNVTFRGVAVQANNKIIAAGTGPGTNDAGDFKVARYNENGAIDQTWGNTGIINTVMSFGIDGVNALKIQTDGKIVVAGYGDDAFLLARYIGNSNTPTGTNVTADFGEVSATFPSVSTEGTTSAVPIDPTTAGTLPAGYSLSADYPAYDITTTASYTPPVTVCLQVPSVTNAMTFAALRILHNEGGTLVDRTILSPDTPAPDFATKTICARVNSLSPFVVAESLAPTAANVSVGGRVSDVKDNPISRAWVSITNTNGETHSAMTNSFGYYRFNEVPVGQTYVISVRHKIYQFNSQVITVFEEIQDANFTAETQDESLKFQL